MADLEQDSPPAFLGTISLSSSPFEHISDPAERARRSAANLALPAEAKRWSLGFYLDPALAGRGIMSAACRTLVDYAIGQGLSRQNILGSAFSNNAPSMCVYSRLRP